MEIKAESIIDDLVQKGNKKIHDLLLKFLKDGSKLENLLSQRLTDKEYFDHFSKIMAESGKTISDSELSKINFQRGKKRFKDISSLIPDVRSPTYTENAYLDVGCSDAIITSVVGQSFGFDLENVYATDIKAPASEKISFELCDGQKLDFPDKKFSFVTLFQVLHHMTHLDAMLADLARICQNKAYVVIREHDLGFWKFHEDSIKLFKLEHACYEILYSSISYDDFIKDYYASYKTKDEWTKKMKEHGFKLDNYCVVPGFNPTNYYYALYHRE